MSDYSLGEVLREQLGREAPAETRPLSVIEAELDLLKQDTRQKEASLLCNYIEIGRRLEEAKAQLQHGQWGTWLERNGFTHSTANNFMRLFREYGADQQSLFGSGVKSQTFGNLTPSKALQLLAIPDEEERERFVAENDVDNMSVRELEKAIRERDAARQEAEAAQADARSAEESRAKMEADMKALEEIHRAAQEGEAQAREALEKAEAELKELRARPVDVAVEVDQEAVERARAEAVAEMQAKVDAAEKQRKEAEKKRKEAEKSLADAKKQAGANAAILSRAEKAEAELAEARRQLEEAAKAAAKSTINSDADLAVFQMDFDQVQPGLNRMSGVILKFRGKGDTETAEKLSKAYLALLDNARRCAE